MVLHELFRLDEMARTETKRKAWRKRELFNRLQSEKGRHFCGIIGPRGVGKSTILRQLALTTEHSFYLSLDTMREVELFAVAESLVTRYGIRTLLIDEIHHAPDYAATLKKIYDFLDLAVVFTSSMALSLTATATDLSRRVKLLQLPPFSFREYLLFRDGIAPAALTLDDIIAGRFSPEHLRTEHRFAEYLQGGLMPFALEEPEPLTLCGNILAKIIEHDIPAVARLYTEETGLIRKCLEFIGRSPVDGINFTSLAKNTGITKYKAEQYLSLLHQAYVINMIFPSGTNVLKEPKVLMCLPFRLLFREYAGVLGELREDFFVETARLAGLTITYLKTTRGGKTPDYLIRHADEDMVIEIGGKGKGREQFKGMRSSKKLILSHAALNTGLHRPLFMAGFLEGAT